MEFRGITRRGQRSILIEERSNISGQILDWMAEMGPN